jgi:hypothetical protein
MGIFLFTLKMKTSKTIRIIASYLNLAVVDSSKVQPLTQTGRRYLPMLLAAASLRQLVMKLLSQPQRGTICNAHVQPRPLRPRADIAPN